MKKFLTFFIFSFLAFSLKAQWVELDIGMENPPVFNDVYAITPDIVVVVGANGTILKTTDGGETWQQKSSGTTETLRKVQFPTANVGYVVGYGGTLLKTIDGGENWISIDMETTANFEGMSVVDENLIYISYSNNLLKSEDGGSTWINYSMDSFYDNYYIQFFNNLIGYSTTSSGSLAKTMNGGQTWEELSGFQPFYFLNENVGFYHESGLLKTTDGGSNFEYVGAGVSDLLSTVLAVNENQIWAIFAGLLDGDGTTRGLIKIKYSETVPYTEDIWYDNNSEMNMNSIHFANEAIGYIAGYKNGKGAIWKNGTGINTMSINEIENNNEIKIYPNPTSKEINVEVENKNPINYSVSLTDFSGKQIYSQSFDTYKIKINTEQFPKGAYILSVKIKEKNYTKKIIIN